MVDTETKAERKAKRFPGRLVWVVEDNHGIDHCLLYCSIKGKAKALKTCDPKTHKISTCRHDGAGLWKMDE